MKVIVHGNCYKFICPECKCVFQATSNEKGVEWHDSCDFVPSASGYFTTCPECGAENVRGVKAWEREDA